MAFLALENYFDVTTVLFIISVTSSSNLLTFYDQNTMWPEHWMVVTNTNTVKPSRTVPNKTIPTMSSHQRGYITGCHLVRINSESNFFIYCRLFCPHLGSFFFVLFLLSLRFGQISPLAFFRWFTATWCDRQQLWKAVITGDTVTRLIIPIRGRGKSPEEGQRWNLAET